ncbi:FAD-binding domain-containing protein [Xylaria bambusicola]|uniref:FAD-binding domain-containing protein n=1 Tax=Xylaria bambusicola TaxID=326684 RepID=UPI0020086D89|nr:FAD-binding domain-containing protein [Xylaria bambusicola]KAI0518000.1 FAD-binding domain-containing protein [Xylaria bambusicola]
MLKFSVAATALLRGVAAGATTSPCDALKAAGLGERLILPGDAGYISEVNSWWAKNGRQNADCFVLPHTREEVATALTALTSGPIAGGNSSIAVRSGGHNAAGFSSTANGVTIDLSPLNATSYNAETNIASIGPGGKWQYVYKELFKHGITVTGGRDGDVGVGGFLLGGGNSYYSGRQGWGCDSVINFEVVLANGTIINANRTVNADLWQALKGGGNNFGIVTRFDMEAVQAPLIFTDTRFLSKNYSYAMVDAVVGFADSDESLADDAFFTFFSHDTDTSPEIFSAAVHVNTQGITNNPTPFDEARSLPALQNFTLVEDIATAAAQSQVAPGAWSYGMTLTFSNDKQIANYVVTRHEEFVESLKKLMAPEDFFTQMFLQPLPSYRWSIGKQRGGNVLGLDDLTNNALLYTAGVGMFSDDAPRDEAYALLMEMEDEVVAFAKSVQGDMEFIYMNYADAGQNPLGTYGASNIEFMKDVAAKYDPTGVFQTLIPGGFKIQNVQ